jgi:hypothetical protein
MCMFYSSDLFCVAEKEDRNVTGAEVLVGSVIPLLFPLTKGDCFAPLLKGGARRAGGFKGCGRRDHEQV